MVHIGMVGGRNSRTKSFGLRPGIGCLLQLAGLLAGIRQRAAAYKNLLLAILQSGRAVQIGLAVPYTDHASHACIHVHDRQTVK